ncbi:zinc finger protein [Colletotrichum truncatum]|uniref:Zinc finger protein n=1 Tax=Colletotrichum truncatum TaxID=5467 RepID=A0ACC3ZJX2_COLTU
MTPAERLECPLLRCRKRFPNHEVMLRHLYTCDQLCTGEYWCYDCGKAEKFTDGKCKRCLGHPGKRRRIMTVAKNFFSSLGQKSKGQDVPDLDMDDVVMPPPPSYDSILVQPQEVELSSSSEILEIDSVEVSLPLPAATLAPSSVFQDKPSNPFGTRPAASGSSMSVMPNLSFDWVLQNEINDMSMGRGDRPSLSVHTHGLSQYRKQHKLTPRTKNLSPSASLRSNASTDTTASYVVSPTSAFSAAWTNAETSITSPTSDSISPGGNLSRGCSNASHYSNASRYSNYNIPLHSFISELPAEEIMLQPPQTLPDDLGCDQQFLSLGVPHTAEPVVEVNVPSAEHIQDVKVISEATDDPAYFVDANSLVGSAWDTLKAHVSSSMEKLQHLSHNPLVGELQSMSPQHIASIGLATLKTILEGRHPSSTIETLCFVHVTYSLSLIVHEDDTHNRSKQLFAQAYLYSNMFVTRERDAYLEVASAIWQPLDLSSAGLDELLLERYEDSISRSSSFKGKDKAPPSRSHPAEDIFLEVAQFFLDELELTALPSKVLESSEVLGSKLWTKHFNDADETMPINTAFTMTVNTVARMLCQNFSHASGLASKVKRFQKRISGGSIRSVRRAELELIQAGKGCMPPQDYFDNYVPEVREHFGALYQQPIPGYVSRMVYHTFGVELMQNIIAGICEKEAIKDAMQGSSNSTGEGNLDELFRTMTNGLDGTLDDLLAIPGDSIPFKEPISDVQVSVDTTGLPDTMTVFYDSSENPTVDILQPLIIDDNHFESPADSAQGSVTSGQKVEIQANDCCEICGYRPKGDPQWFKGSMAKHKKLQHSTAPPKIYRCPYPGCTSQYKNRPDNLKQHQQDKGHFVDGENERRPSKRKKRE